MKSSEKLKWIDAMKSEMKSLLASCGKYPIYGQISSKRLQTEKRLLRNICTCGKVCSNSFMVQASKYDNK